MEKSRNPDGLPTVYKLQSPQGSKCRLHEQMKLRLLTKSSDFKIGIGR